ncbi:SDR family oxidoreductase [Candidatus Marinimicrobia bacterium PRS2]|nr:SDR family oxidoreductase [Candidatus Marinimicrobia bacterium PRS2]
MPETAVITGASSGVGKSLAIQLSDAGYKVVLAARSEDKLNAIAEEIQKMGGNCLVVPTDVSQPEQINNLKDRTLEYGDVFVVINNAGLGKFCKIEDVTLEDWNRQLDVNLRASFLVSQAFIPGMKRRKKGTLVFMNSVAGKKGYPYSAAYVASKHGMRGLADSLREELREDNIKVISIHPGAVDTPFWDGAGVNFPREEMLDTNTLAQSIVHAIQSPGNFTIEELVVRRTAGDF